jgi:hypothetical protein
MLRLLSRGLLAAALGLSFVAGSARPGWADDDDDDDEEGGRRGEDGDEDEDEDDDRDQPPVTAGGLYTLKTFPVREISRPLTMTQNILQMRASAGTDISAKGAFGTGGLSLEAIYGYRDNFNFIGGFTNAYNMKQFGAYFGFEGALAYDLVNLRVAANIYRNAIPRFENFCKPNSSLDPIDPQAPSACGGAMMTPNAELVNLPNGQYDSGDIKFSIDIGLPFRYAIKPEIAIVALQTLMSIDFNSADRSHFISQPQQMTDPTTGEQFTVTRSIPRPNKTTPDLKPSIGIATNPVAPLSVVIFAQLRIPDFDTEAGAFQVPVTGRLQFSPNQKFDIGLEFTLLNVKPPEGQSPIDNRFLALFVQSRVGK